MGLGRGCATPLRGFEDLLSDVKESSNYMAQASCSRGVVQYKVGGVFFYSIASVKLLAWKYKFKLVSLQSICHPEIQINTMSLGSNFLIDGK